VAESEGPIVIGVLGQWASGKTEAARTLIRHLGGEGNVVFLTDRDLLVEQALGYFLGLDDSEITTTLEPDGTRQLQGEHAVSWLGPGDELDSVELDHFRWRPNDEVIGPWHDAARLALGEQICARSVEDASVVIEAAFGPDLEDLGGVPLWLSIANLFARLENAGVGPRCVKWIIVEAGHKVRAERNRRRGADVPVDIFDQLSADGGDLTPEQQKEWENRGMILKRVRNEHNDIERFRSDTIAAFEEIWGTG
jgi:hypothetical protein